MATGFGGFWLVRALQKGHRIAKADIVSAKLELAMTPRVIFDWLKADQTERDAFEGSVPLEDLAGNRLADIAANLGTALHEPCELTLAWQQWHVIAQAVLKFWLLVGPKMHNGPVRLPALDLVPQVVEAQNLRTI
eukprot:3241620-Amphidinium_carterae.1